MRRCFLMEFDSSYCSNCDGIKNNLCGYNTLWVQHWRGLDYDVNLGDNLIGWLFSGTDKMADLVSGSGDVLLTYTDVRTKEEYKGAGEYIFCDIARFTKGTCCKVEGVGNRLVLLNKDGKRIATIKLTYNQKLKKEW